MWDYARQMQADYDLIVNLPMIGLLYLTPFFTSPCPFRQHGFTL